MPQRDGSCDPSRYGGPCPGAPRGAVGAGRVSRPDGRVLVTWGEGDYALRDVDDAGDTRRCEGAPPAWSQGLPASGVPSPLKSNKMREGARVIRGDQIWFPMDPGVDWKSPPADAINSISVGFSE